MTTALLPATELVRLFRARELSPVEVTAAVLDRVRLIESGGRSVNAFCLVTEELAMSHARAAERRWLRGQPAGLLDGVPVSIKDLLLTAGLPTLRGSRLIDPALDWPEDSPSAARLREHGAVLIGKTTTPELGWKGVTDSPLTGVTHNPWRHGRTAGGSSGGAAAAVALGMGALAVGTDGGGSVRIPAGFSGVFGLKPTYGRIPIYPASPFGTLAHAGPMARTVADAALMLDVLAGPDSRDWSALPPPEHPYRTALDRPLAGTRIAFSPTLGYVRVDPEVAAAVAAAVGVLERLGATVEQVDPGFTDPVEAFAALWFAGAAKSIEQFDEARWPELDPGLQEICADGRARSAMNYLDATAERTRLGVLMGRFHERHHLLVTPTLPITAFEAGVEVPAGSASPRWMSWTPFSYPFNLTQQPAASVPCGFDSAGLPIGMQVVGARHADAAVLAACHAYEQATEWHRHHPPTTRFASTM